jgi:putative transposase
MSRKLRYFPPSTLIEVTCRTFQGRFLLRPSTRLRRIIDGLLAKATRKYQVECHAYCFMSNHYHLLLTPTDAETLARFMCFFNSKLAREICRLYDWSDKVWGGRYHHAIVSREPAAQEARLRYLMSQGCKEGLISHPADWPGANSIRTLTHGKSRRGIYIDRTREYRLRQRGLDPSPDDYCEEIELALTPLPCWADWSPRARRQRCREIVIDIVEETKSRHTSSGTRPLGVEGVLSRPSVERPGRIEPRPAPLIHAATRAVRRAFAETYALFFQAYRESAARLREGHKDVVFPPGCFPPAGPFRPWEVPV